MLHCVPGIGTTQTRPRQIDGAMEISGVVGRDSVPMPIFSSIPHAQSAYHRVQPLSECKLAGPVWGRFERLTDGEWL